MSERINNTILTDNKLILALYSTTVPYKVKFRLSYSNLQKALSKTGIKLEHSKLGFSKAGAITDKIYIRKCDNRDAPKELVRHIRNAFCHLNINKSISSNEYIITDSELIDSNKNRIQTMKGVVNTQKFKELIKELSNLNY